MWPKRCSGSEATIQLLREIAGLCLEEYPKLLGEDTRGDFGS